MRGSKLAIVAIAAATGLGAAACSSDGSSVASGGDATTTTAGGTGSTGSSVAGGGGVTCPAGLKIGFFGALTGAAANLGINEANGVELAIEQFSAANPGCKIAFEKLDSAGDPAQAPALAAKAVADTKLIAIAGPAFSGESKVANPILDEGTLPNISPSATNPSLSKNGWKFWKRAVGNDNAQGPAAAKYITGTLNAKKVAVIDEGTEYGKGIADIVRADVPKTSGATIVVSDKIDAKATDYSATVNKVKAAAPDAIFFGGYYDEGGRFTKQLRDAGVKAPIVAGDGANDPGFIKGAGAAAEGAILLAPAGDITKDAAGADFVKAYKAKFNADPGLYSDVSYDIGNQILAAVKAGKTDRKGVDEYLDANEYKGLTKTYKYGADGELSGDITIFAFKVVGDKVVFQSAVK